MEIIELITMEIIELIAMETIELITMVIIELSNLVRMPDAQIWPYDFWLITQSIVV